MKNLPRTLEPNELAAMLKASEISRRDNIILKCLYFLGMRNSEVQLTKVQDFDFEKSVVTLGNGEKMRSVPIQQGLVNELRVWIGDRRDGYLIPGRRKKPMSDRHIRRIVKHYAKLANVRKYEEIHPHTLRHSYAIHLQKQGVPLYVIQKLLGHSRIETTTIYLHMGMERMKEWVDRAFTENK